jgi:hypothetical protein
MLDLAAITTRETWTRLAPDFHIGDETLFRDAAALDLGDTLRDSLKDQLCDDGYFQQSGFDFGVDLAAMASTVRALSAAGIVPAFAFVYDEFWLPFHRLHRWYEALLGDYAMMPDFWAWNLEPSRGDAGWTPHRDKGHFALLPDRSAMSLTTWIPLTPATPLNGCMYIVPASFDPVYGTPEDRENRFTLPSVRALPAQPGDVLMWNQAVLHWGGRTSPRATESRVSIAFEFQRRDVPPFNAPLLQPRIMVPFELRLKLIAMQILQYRHMYAFDAATEALARQLAG